MSYKNTHNGRSNFAAQFMRSTVAKIKGINSIGTGLFGWETGTYPSNLDSYDLQGSTSNQNNPSSTRDGYNPSAIHAREVSFYQVPASAGWFGYTYNQWATDGKVFDKSKGLRMQMLVWADDAYWARPFLVVHNNTIGPWYNSFGALSINGPGDDKTQVMEGGNSPTQDWYDLDWPTDPSDSAGAWILHSVEIPADFTGNATITTERLGNSPWWRAVSHTIVRDYSSDVLDAVTCMHYSRTGDGGFDGTFHVNHWWVGSLDDAWQTTPSS